jgi:PAS domain S-box-containing protein
MSAENSSKACATASPVDTPLGIAPAANADPLYADLARLAAQACGAEFASIALCDGTAVWCSAAARLVNAAAAPCDPFLAEALQSGEPIEVVDAAHDQRVGADGFFIDGVLIRSYAGCALRTADGDTLGVLAVYGTAPRRLCVAHRDSLSLVARQTVAQAELRARLAELALLSPPRSTAASRGAADAAMAHAGFNGTISDFTDLVAARGDLRRAESLFLNTFDQAPIGIAYADRDGRFLRCNPAFGALLHFSPEDLSTRSNVDLTHAEDAACSAAELEKLWRGEVDFVDLEKRYVRKDGSIQWVRATTALVRDAGGNPDCSVEFLRDISNRKELAAALLQQQTLLEAVITDLPVALVACNTAGRITHHNRAAVELNCIDAPHAPAQTYLADGLTPVSDYDRPLARALRGETISNLELVIAPQGANRRITLSSARRLISPAGQTLGAVAVVQDITERKQSELNLERVHKELMTASRQAGMAEVATNVLHNVGNILNSVNISASLVAERVKQSKASGLSRVAALLQDQGARLGEFITGDARGKRIPEYLATLSEQLTNDQQMTLQELASLRENLEHIKDTVAMQQSYAKLCGITETVEVADLVEDSLRLNAGAFARHGVTLQREYGEVPPITVDKHKVLQILVNLVRNAKYACDESGRTDKRVELRIEPAVNAVRISVIDNGVGIAPENMSRLFSHGFTTRKSGHGFGLHSGALAAHDLGGTLRAESAGSGQGASFILELPYAPRDAARA